MNSQQINDFVNRLTAEGIVTDSERLREEMRREFAGDSGTGGTAGMGAGVGGQAMSGQGGGGGLGANYRLPRGDRPNSPNNFNYNYIDPVRYVDPWLFDPLLPLANLSGPADQLPIPLSRDQ
jgi:hypothetical protein